MFNNRHVRSSHIIQFNHSAEKMYSMICGLTLLLNFLGRARWSPSAALLKRATPPLPKQVSQSHSRTTVSTAILSTVCKIQGMILKIMKIIYHVYNIFVIILI